ncbi:MAG: pantoate--beta-alanine ligase [Desulfatiglandaceae bacterium]|jgi:pantoate--beta-alanine ligase
MQVIKSIDQMQETSDLLRMKGKTIALVPTMGFLHEGHLELMRVGKRHADQLIISIFVNPRQFGPSEDFDDYPRNFEGDLEKAGRAGVDIVFVPPAEEMYPFGFQTSVLVKDLADHLCGLTRPAFFGGVTTVVSKLFNIVRPHMAIFGQKDYQQLTIVTRMVMDLNMDIRIFGVPTVREPDGLAMSSRNGYLDPDERISALCLKKSLDLAGEMFASGERTPKAIIGAIAACIEEHPFTRIDYVNLCDPVTLEDVDVLGEETLLALAVWVGKTRLIDNCLIRENIPC